MIRHSRQAADDIFDKYPGNKDWVLKKLVNTRSERRCSVIAAPGTRHRFYARRQRALAWAKAAMCSLALTARSPIGL